MRNHTLRFMDNNLAALLPMTYITKSSEVSGFPFANTRNDKRSQYWKPQGFFKITATNNQVYINDGSPKTITVPVAGYTSPASLATAIQTALNAASSGWTVTYSSVTFSFVIARSGTATLVLTTSLNSIWDTIGFTTGLDLTGTSFPADQQRNHTHEEIQWDFTAQREITFFAMISPIDQAFNISTTAVVNIKANNVNNFDAAPLDVDLEVNPKGLFHFFDDIEDTTYRYWKLTIIDRLNPSGPEGFKFSHIYLGDHFTFEQRAVEHGYQKTYIDPSATSEAESGTLFFDKKIKYREFSGLNLAILKRDQKDALEQMFQETGISTPFYISVDPLMLYTNTLAELTGLFRFSDAPSFTHSFRDFFSTSVNFKEVI